MRSKLFVPGARPELFAKALAGEADALSFDLEDAVAEAREAVADLVASAAVAQAAKLIIVRSNAADSPHSLFWPRAGAGDPRRHAAGDADPHRLPRP